MLLRFAYRSVTDTFVNVTREIDAYSELFGTPKKKFSFLPYCYRLTGYDYELNDKGYIWSGGNGNRDYGLLIEAVRDIKRPVIINSTRESLFKGLSIPDQVKIEGATPAEFRRSMAGCTLGVLPMVGNKLHSGGQQTFLGLMKMGKPVILTDPDGGKDYIKSGYNGILVPFGDVEQLKEAIVFLLRNPDKAKEMGRRGVASVTNNSEEDYMRAIWERACREAEIWRKRNTHGQTHHSQT
jgi:glycosyltransferase involved in cell wall biosynthesis